ncbi:MAG: type IV toxin-antitoxin system AbiEi family antitoxin domain-containing protein [Patescibacteria group bacterium]
MLSGRLLQLRRGLYALAPPFQKKTPHPFLVANRLVGGSYVSLQSALAYHGLIPEGVNTVTSVTPGRPAAFATPFGRYVYRHLKPALLAGYSLSAVGGGQEVFLAEPEKALLDLVHLTPDGASPAYLRELRLQNLELLHPGKLSRYALSPKLRRAVEFVLRLRTEESEGFVELCPRRNTVGDVVGRLFTLGKQRGEPPPGGSD